MNDNGIYKYSYWYFIAGFQIQHPGSQCKAEHSLTILELKGEPLIDQNIGLRTDII
jgi:hypothetical protein